MVKFNENYLNVKDSYLFSEIAKRVAAFEEANPDKKVIRLGIGDVTNPLSKAVINALEEGVKEMSKAETFKGYGPEQGYAFLRQAIKGYYQKRNVELDIDEVFISDGAKSDTGNITDMFSKDNTVLVPDPVYPVYVDTNTMNGRDIIFADATDENGFLPLPDPKVDADIIYICSPNNPTGAVYNKAQLKQWVDYALEKGAIILFDAAYERFITDETLPRSIYEIEGAKDCAVEFCSLSKTAGFRGTRCGYTIVPKNIKVTSSKGQDMYLNKMWLRRQSTKFNGVPYIVQKAAAAVFTEEGLKQADETLALYRKNAKIIASTLDEIGIKYYGGINSPYIWLKCPDNTDSWEFFDRLLNEAQVVGTPGAGFGKNGNNFFRLTSFNNEENTKEAMERLKKMLNK